MDKRTAGRLAGQAQTNMPFQILWSWGGDKNGTRRGRKSIKYCSLQLFTTVVATIFRYS